MSTVSTSDAAALRAWVRSGDRRRAGDWLVKRFAGEVLGLCTAMVRDRTAAEDLTQEVFGAAFAALDDFRGDASVRTWILAIARNRCIDHLRARQRDPWPGGGDDAEPDMQPDDAPLPADLLGRRAEVEAALNALAEGDRALVVLRFRHGLEYAELAAAFGLREGTVRMRLSRALKRMRDALEAPVGRTTMAGALAAPRAAAPAAAPRQMAALPEFGAPPAPGGPPPMERNRAGAARPIHPLAAYFAGADAPTPVLSARLAALVDAM